MNTRASEESMNDLHSLVVKQAINLMTNGRPIISKETGEPVMVNGEVLYMPPTAAELTAAARILKDNGIDTPALNSEASSEEVDAVRAAMDDIGLDEVHTWQ